MILLLLDWVFSCDFRYLVFVPAFFAFCFSDIYLVIALLFTFMRFPFFGSFLSFLSMPDTAFSFVSFGQCVTQCFPIFKQVSRESATFYIYIIMWDSLLF